MENTIHLVFYCFACRFLSNTLIFKDIFYLHLIKTVKNDLLIQFSNTTGNVKINLTWTDTIRQLDLFSAAYKNFGIS